MIREAYPEELAENTCKYIKIHPDSEKQLHNLGTIPRQKSMDRAIEFMLDDPGKAADAYKTALSIKQREQCDKESAFSKYEKQTGKVAITASDEPKQDGRGME